jgi:hypothetical protein
MWEPSRTAKVSVAAGFIISAAALVWLLAEPFRGAHFSGLDRLGYACVVLCALGATGVSWAAIVAYIGRRYEWSPAKCGRAALTSYLLFSGVLWIAHLSTGSGALLVMVLASPIADVCRRLAYPELTHEQLHAAQPPLTLFPKK